MTALALGRVRPGVGAGWAGPGLVVAACCFNTVLCLIHTQGWAESGAGAVVGASLLIVGAGLWVVRDAVGPGLAGGGLLVAGVAAGLKLLNPELDLKILFDLLIAPVFFLLGRRCLPGTADRMLGGLLVLVIGVGLVELVLPEVFQRVLDILSFYTSKGAVSVDAVNYGGTRFFASAQRSEDAGRMLLPGLLGGHRVSSIFLEPISMGNFALIALGWVLGSPRRRDWGTVLLGLGAVTCVVLPDSRQATAAGVMMLALRGSPWRGAGWVAVLLPAMVLAAVVGLGMATLDPGQAIGIESDDFQGRLVFSGQLLASWGWGEWLGLVASELYTADTGYAYLVNNVGLPVAVMVWVRGMAAAEGAGAMRGNVALYAATSLCVGASLFSIKTAALLWFLLGVADGAGRRGRA